MIVITGANGHFGRQVVDGLLEKLPGAQIGVSVRDPAQAEDLGRRGVQVRRGDFADPASLAEAFEGAEQVLIVSSTAPAEEGVRQHGNAIQAAKDAGVRRLLYTSHQAAGPSATFAPARKTHAPTEALLQASGLPYVSLRNGFYAESALYQLSGVQQMGKITLPNDGPVSWTARADLAEAAVAALTQPDLFEGISPPLTGTQALDFTEIAGIVSALLGRTVVRETLSDEAYRQGLIGHGLSEETADSYFTLYTAARAGEFAVVDPTLGRVLGRPPTPMTEVLRDFLEKPKTLFR